MVEVLSEFAALADLLGRWTLVVLVLLGALPLASASYQFLLIGMHATKNHYDEVAPCFPRVAILIPAWNEAAVIGTSIDRLMRLDYPPDRLRIYVVDDASTDATPDVVLARSQRHPGQIVHLRREKGGEGKAHTLNHGLREILADDWMEALLIMDADVVYEPDSLRRMTRHFGDPEVGAVTTYIKEGTASPNWMNRFIGYEYITAQAAARRSQNVLGAVACLAGGAQLHTRANLVAIGGEIDTSSLAEDTFTTFKTQLAGNRVVFEGNATVWAEEPDDIDGLWKQRLRWARGNVQVTLRYRHLWFRPTDRHRLGSWSFGLFWFCLFLLPVFMIAASASLVALFFIDFPLSWATFRALWIINALSYVFITCFALMIDTDTARKTWREAAMFPGVVSVLIILYSCFPRLFRWMLFEAMALVDIPTTVPVLRSIMLFAYVWLAGTMLVAWGSRNLEKRARLRWLSPLLVYAGGYGPLLCAITFASYVKEARGAEMAWDKTEKSGKMVAA
ncbi:MAG: glycosyltransferase [Actinomycetota bacterium]